MMFGWKPWATSALGSTIDCWMNAASLPLSASVRSGPTLPLDPAGSNAWHEPHPARRTPPCPLPVAPRPRRLRLDRSDYRLRHRLRLAFDRNRPRGGPPGEEGISQRTGASVSGRRPVTGRIRRSRLLPATSIGESFTTSETATPRSSASRAAERGRCTASHTSATELDGQDQRDATVQPSADRWRRCPRSPNHPAGPLSNARVTWL